MVVDAVFESGGVKGIGLAGAVCYLEAQGYEWGKLAGTSSGAIVASLLAAGYRGEALKSLLFDLNFRRLLDKNLASRFNLLIGYLLHKGICSGDYFEKWISYRLAQEGVRTFKDLKDRGSVLKVIVSDVSRGCMVTLPDDLPYYGLDPDQFLVAKAVRMSMSIPVLFEPVKLKYSKGKSYFVDGAVFSSFPLWLFDGEKDEERPIIGFKLGAAESDSPVSIGGPLGYLYRLVRSLLNSRGLTHIHEKDWVRTIWIDPGKIGVTDFGLSQEEKGQLFMAGYSAAEKAVAGWNARQTVT